MSLFSKQPVHCPRCGVRHEAELTASRAPAMMYHLCCSDDCREEMRLRAARSALGRHTPPPADKACAFCADGIIKCDCGPTT